MTENATQQSITMVGGPNTGKSHFTFQLYGRLRAKMSDLKLREMPNEDLFREGLDRLNKGLAAEHTNIDKYDNADLRIVDDDGTSFDLLWPDYGGEQILRILETRSVDLDWKERLAKTDGLLLFIRLAEIIDYKNMIEHPIDVKLKERKEKGDTDTDSILELHSQVGIVEMLQILLWTAERNSARLISSPKLGVVLTCWDELDSQGSDPAILLKERMPFLHQYIYSVWSKESVIIQGLSSLEQTLDEEKQNENFREKGPGAFGYVVSPTGEHSPDLTLLVSRILKLLDGD